MVSEGKGKPKVCFVCLFDGLERDLQWDFGPAECVLGNRRESKESRCFCLACLSRGIRR